MTLPLHTTGATGSYLHHVVRNCVSSHSCTCHATQCPQHASDSTIVSYHALTFSTVDHMAFTGTYTENA